jgi:hypothetical protein
MDPFVAVNRQLVIAQGNINDHRVAVIGLIHLKPVEDLDSPVDGIHVGTTAFHENADLAAGTPLGASHRFYNPTLFFFGEELVLSGPGKNFQQSRIKW